MLTFFVAFAKPVPVLGIIFGLGWGDTILLILLTVELIALIVYCMAVYSRYAQVWNAKKQGKSSPKKKSKTNFFKRKK